MTSDESSLHSQSGPAWKGITSIFIIKKIKTQESAIKITASVFWDSGGVIYVDFLPHSVAINVHYYSNLLLSEVHQVMWKKRPVKLSNKIIILHDNAVQIWQN